MVLGVGGGVGAVNEAGYSFRAPSVDLPVSTQPTPCYLRGLVVVSVGHHRCHPPWFMWCVLVPAGPAVAAMMSTGGYKALARRMRLTDLHSAGSVVHSSALPEPPEITKVGALFKSLGTALTRKADPPAGECGLSVT